jgi:LacI family transcriptional regulator
MKTNRTRLKDIAEKLGVSAATVSRALRDRLEISDSLKEKIKKTAKEMHYIPNFLASNLRTQRNFSIGVIIPKIVHQYMSLIISGILEEAYEQNYQVIISVTEQSYEKEVKAVEQFASGIVDGVLICVGNNTKDFGHIELLKNDSLPFVFFDKDVSKIEAPKVVVDDYTGAFAAVEHLIEQGYRRIAHIQDNLVGHTSQKRMKGYYSALKKYNIEKDINLVAQVGHISIENSRIVMEDLLRTYPDIDAVFGITDEIAIGAMQAAQKMGRKIPSEFGVVGFSNWQIGSVVSPTLSTVVQPSVEMGRYATKLLIQRIEEPRQYRHIFPTKILKTSLLVRESSSRK